MGRGKVELKRIENETNKQVTFSKRRKGLVKKALELSVLCDAEVALIIFSPRGKLYHFCSSSSMAKTLERYQRCSCSTQLESFEQMDETIPCLTIKQSSYEEYLKLKARVVDLQQTQRILLGEELGSVNMKELEELEHQLESSLSHIRSKKTQSMLDRLADLQKKEQTLLQSNESLVKKLTWEPAGAQTSLTYGRTSWGSSDDQVNAAAASTSTQNMSGNFSPPWWMFI